MAFTKLFSSVNLWRISYSTISKRYCSAVSEDSPTCGKKSDEARQSSNDQPENKVSRYLQILIY